MEIMWKRWSRLFALKILFLIFVCIRADSNSTSYEEQMKQTKEKLLKMIQKETHKLSGFEEFGIIPVTYPVDICLMEIDKTLYAICLNIERTDRGNLTMLKVLKKVPANPRNPRNQLYGYDLIYEYKTNAARAMDCVSMGTEGFIAVVNDFRSSKYSNIAEGSPVFKLKNDQIHPLQYFTLPYQSHVHLVKNHGMLFMLQTFDNFGTLASDTRSQCPILKWDDSTFNAVDKLPCLNAVRVEPFRVENDIYVAFANHMDEHGNRETFSTIYQYNMDTHTFNLTQKLKTFGAIDLKHFHINDGIVNEHYLIVANTVDNGADPASNAVIYHFNQGHFIPMQILNFETEIKQFLPVVTETKEFVLLISNKNAPTKTYQFDGWNFVETTIRFTGGSFGTGVSKMRTHKLNDEFLVIVVANSHMYRDTPNLFRVKFQIELEYDFVKAFNMFDDWYKTAKQKIQTDRLLEIYHQMEKLELPQNFGTLNLEDTKVNTLRAGSLSGTSIPINFTDIKRTLHKTNELLTKESVRRPKRLNESTESNATNVEYHLLEEPLSVDALTVSGSVTVAKVNGHHIDDLLRSESDLHLNNLMIAYLLVPKDSNMTHTTSKRVKRDAVTDDEIMHLNDVVVDGFVNRFNFSSLIENALRIDQAEQRLTSDVKFQTISATTITVKDNKISDFDLNRIASIKDNETLINEPLIFAQLLSTNELNIAERLNQFTVQNGKLNILLKKSKRVQIITGDKEFDAVNLLEPITLHGRINISSPMMNKIKPIVTVDEELIINSDILISGNVTVKRSLEAANIFGQSIRFSLAQVQGDAIRVDDVNIDVPLEFSQPIFTEDIRLPTRLNGIRIDSFIQRNSTGVQQISARKTIISDLSIENGFCSANEINGVNLQILNTTMLKRTANNQTFTGTIQIKRITAEQVNSVAMSFGKTLIDRLLTKNTNQTINGNVVIHGNVFISNGSALQAEHLITPKNVFGFDLDAILDDCYNYSNESIHLTSSKWFQNVTIEELVIESDFWNVASTDAIVKRLDALSRGVLINQTLDYDNQFTIDRLYVTGTINKIPSESFGREWLLSEGDQTFLAPQRFTNFTATENVQLLGTLNGNQLQRLVSETIWRNTQEPIFLKHAIFENIKFEKSLNLEGQFAGMLFPDDLILSHSQFLQNFAETIIFNSPVHVLGTLSVSDTLNGFNFPQMCDLIEPKRDTNYGLEIKGGVQFLTDPIIKNLNSEPFDRIVATTWFTDNPSVNFSDSVKFGDVILNKPITVTSLVNGLSLESISDRYLSLTKPQNISSSIYFRNTVHFRNTLQTDSISLWGQLRLHESDIHFNISHFEANVLKNVPGAQIIPAPWTVREFHFLGNLNSVTVNYLNLNDDVVRWDRPDMNLIRAEKSFKSLSINQLLCHAGCSVQGVDIDEWISKGVLLDMNYTIQGTVFINDAAVSYIEALGRVNNDPFNSLTILLKHSDQRIDRIVTIGPNANPINVTPLTFNEINANYINGHNFTAFIQNRVTRGPANQINANILSNLQFVEPVTFENLYTSERLIRSIHVDGKS